MMPTSLGELLSGLLPNVVLIILWVLPALIPLLNLRKRNMDETTKAVWVLIILLLPVIGALSYFLMNNDRQGIDKR